MNKNDFGMPMPQNTKDLPSAALTQVRAADAREGLIAIASLLKLDDLPENIVKQLFPLIEEMLVCLKEGLEDFTELIKAYKAKEKQDMMTVTGQIPPRRDN